LPWGTPTGTSTTALALARSMTRRASPTKATRMWTAATLTAAMAFLTAATVGETMTTWATARRESAREAALARPQQLGPQWQG
jgi:hypothetical protein